MQCTSHQLLQDNYNFIQLCASQFYLLYEHLRHDKKVPVKFETYILLFHSNLLLPAKSISYFFAMTKARSYQKTMRNFIWSAPLRALKLCGSEIERAVELMEQVAYCLCAKHTSFLDRTPHRIIYRAVSYHLFPSIRQINQKIKNKFKKLKFIDKAKQEVYTRVLKGAEFKNGVFCALITLLWPDLCLR